MLFLVATVTPFDSKGRVDLGRLRAHVLWLVTQGVDGFVPTGTTGEFLYLTDREKEAIHRTVLDASGAAPVYPCTWDPSPSTTAYLTDQAREIGASGILLPPPLFYKVDDDTIRRWYGQIAETARLPILAYHNPAHIKSGISPQLYAQLRKDDVIAGMKDSSHDIYRLRRLAGSDPGGIWGGGDAMLSQIRQLGPIAGFISAAGNVWPKFLQRLYRDKEVQLSEALHERMNRLRRAGGLRAMKGLLRMGCRMPLGDVGPEMLVDLPPPET